MPLTGELTSGRSGVCGTRCYRDVRRSAAARSRTPSRRSWNTNLSGQHCRDQYRRDLPPVAPMPRERRSSSCPTFFDCRRDAPSGARSYRPKPPVFAYTRDKLTFAAVVGAVALAAVVVALLTFRGRTVVHKSQLDCHRFIVSSRLSGMSAKPPFRWMAVPLPTPAAGRLLIQEVSGGPAAEIVGADVAPERI